MDLDQPVDRRATWRAIIGRPMSGLVATWRAGCRRFGAARSGNVAVITALAAVPLFCMGGFVMDYTTALSDKGKLDAAVDAAAMAAIATAQSVIQGGGSTATATQQALARARGSFAANAGAVGFQSAISITPTISRTNQTLTATVSYSMTMNNNFGRLLGNSQTNITGSSTSTLTMTTYINYYIIVDNSQSMGVGSTPTDMTNLYNRSAGLHMVNGGCVFGCHVASPGDPYSMEYVAHNMSPSITLRIDAAVSAIQTVITQAQTQSGSSGAVKIGLYTMSGYPMSGSRLTTLSSPSSNFTALSALASTIDLGPNVGSAGYGDSDFVNSMTSVNALLSSQGDGSSQTTPINYVILITDGVDDTYSSGCTMTHCTSAFPDYQCTTLQSKANVGIINTVYNPIYANNNYSLGLDSRYQALVQPFANSIAPALQSCASSSSLYFEATDGPAITSSLSRLFASTVSAAHFSQ